MPSLLNRSGHAQRFRQPEPLAPVTPAQVTSLSVAMKYAVALVTVSTAALLLLVAYTLVQEVQLRGLATHKEASFAAFNFKEEAIVSVKNQVTQLRLAMETERTKTKELEKRRGELERSKKEAEEKLQTCNSEKARIGGEGGVSRISCPTLDSLSALIDRSSVFLIRKVMGRRRLKLKQPSMSSKVRQERMIYSCCWSR